MNTATQTSWGTHRRKAEYNMKIPPSSRYEVVVQILLSWWSPWKLSFHNWNKLSSDFIEFITSKKVRDFSGGEDVIQIFQKSFILDLIVGEDECDAFTLQTYIRTNTQYAITMHRS